MTKIQQVQVILGVDPDNKWGPKSQAALDAAKVEVPFTLEPSDDGRHTSPVDSRSEQNISTLHPKVQPLARTLIQMAKENGIDAKVTSGTRTYAEQDALFAKGGVTRARGGQSNHNFGLAFDLTIFDGSTPIYNSPLYKNLGAMGKTIGLAWGGDWSSFQDEPHFEFRPAWAHGMAERQILAELRHRHDANRDMFA